MVQLNMIEPGAADAVTGFAGSIATVRKHLSKGCRLVMLTNGTFSMIDIIRAAADVCGGPVRCWLSTWTVGVKDTDNIDVLVKRGVIESLTLVVDRSFTALKPAYCQAVLDAFGPDAIRVTRTHAKVAVVEGGGLRFVIRGSLNLNRNIRLENVDIDEGDMLADFWRTTLEAVSEVIRPGDLVADESEFKQACAAMPQLGNVPAAEGFKAWTLEHMATARAQRRAIGKLPNLARACRMSMADLRAALTAGAPADLRVKIRDMLQ